MEPSVSSSAKLASEAPPPANAEAASEQSDTTKNQAQKPPTKFSARSRFLLRLGPKLIVQTRMFLSSPGDMTQLLFDEVMKQIKGYTAEEITPNPVTGDLMIVGRYTPTSPRHHVKPSLHFLYYWVPVDFEFNYLDTRAITSNQPSAAARSSDAMDVDEPAKPASNAPSSSSSTAQTEVLTPKKEKPAQPTEGPGAAAPTGAEETKFQLKQLKVSDQMLTIVVIKPGKKDASGEEIDFSQGAVVENQISRYFEPDDQQQQASKKRKAPSAAPVAPPKAGSKKGAKKK